jgi:hypothetical protein
MEPILLRKTVRCRYSIFDLDCRCPHSTGGGTSFIPQENPMSTSLRCSLIFLLLLATVGVLTSCHSPSNADQKKLLNSNGLPAEVDVALDLDNVGGNITPAQRDALLASKEVQVTGDYEPRVKIKGVNAEDKPDLFACGANVFRSCLEFYDSEFRHITLAGTSIQKQGTRLIFKLPSAYDQQGRILYQIKVDLSPAAFVFKLSPQIQGGSYVPVASLGGDFSLNGTLDVKGAILDKGGQDYVANPIECQGPVGDAKNGWRWPPVNRFASYTYMADPKYAISQEENTKQQFHPPAASEFAGLKVQKAWLGEKTVDGHRLEKIDIDTSGSGDAICDAEGINGINNFKYKILLVDGKPVSYSLDTCLSQAQGKHFVDEHTKAEWLDDGSIASYDHYQRDPSLPSTSSMGKWNVFASQYPASCVFQPKPDPQTVQNLVKDAQRVRRMFHP